MNKLGQFHCNVHEKQMYGKKTSLFIRRYVYWCKVTLRYRLYTDTCIFKYYILDLAAIVPPAGHICMNGVKGDVLIQWRLSTELISNLQGRHCGVRGE